MEERHGREVHRVARVRLERPDAALAQDHVRVAGADDVLGGHQPLLDGRAVAALEHDRPRDPPDRRQQRVVLHVPRADLEDVGVLGDDVDLARLHDLGDDRQAGPLARLGEVAERLDAEPLEAVRTGPRLERAAAEDRRARPPSTASAVSNSWSRLSTEHGPAIIVREPSPMTASRTRMTVSSGWNSREVSLNGRLIGVTGLDARQGAEAAHQLGLRGPISPTTAMTVRSVADVVERRQPLGEDVALDAEDLGLAGAAGHHDEHRAVALLVGRSAETKKQRSGPLLHSRHDPCSRA